MHNHTLKSAYSVFFMTVI